MKSFNLKSLLAIALCVALLYAAPGFALGTLPSLGTGSAVQGTDLFISRQGADTVDKSVTASQLKTFTTITSNQLTVYAAGTLYSLTNTQALLDFGTTDPTLTLNAAGTYLLHYCATLNYNGATFAAVRTATVKLRRTNNTAADVTGTLNAVKTSVTTTETSTLARVCGDAVYTTANADDSISVFGALDVVPTAGSFDAAEASIIAFRLQQ